MPLRLDEPPHDHCQYLLFASAHILANLRPDIGIVMGNRINRVVDGYHLSPRQSLQFRLVLL